MCEAIEERSGHLGIAEHAWPFTEGQVCGDDNRGAFVELAYEVEQQLAAGLRERQITEFIQDQKVETRYQIGRPVLTFCACFSIKLVHQIDDVEEPASPSFSDAGAGNADGEVGFACSSAADQHEVALLVEEVTRRQIAHQGLVDFRHFEVELVELFCEWQLGDSHLVFDRAGLLLRDLSME